MASLCWSAIRGSSVRSARAGFPSLLDRLPAIELTEVIRQRLIVDREAIEAQKGERFGEALGVYAEAGRVEVCESPFITRAAMVEGWARDGDPEGSLMIARSNRDVGALNAAARSLLAEQEALGGPEIEVAGSGFQRGDVIVTRARAYSIGVRNQDRWRVLAVDPVASEVEVERIPDRRRATLRAQYLASTGWGGVPAIQHGYAGTIAITRGPPSSGPMFFSTEDSTHGTPVAGQAARRGPSPQARRHDGTPGAATTSSAPTFEIRSGRSWVSTTPTRTSTSSSASRMPSSSIA